MTFREIVICKKCGEVSNICKLSCKTRLQLESEQDEMFNSLLFKT